MNTLYLKTSRQIYAKYLLAMNINSLSSVIQSNVMSIYYRDNTYNELTNQQKKDVNKKIQDEKKKVKQSIESITRNIQYQDWLCKLIKQQDVPVQYVIYSQEQVRNLFDSYDMVKKVETDKKKRDIMKFVHFEDLSNYVWEKQNDKRVQKLNIKNKKLNFNCTYTNGKYASYIICQQDKEQFQELYGQNGYKTAWCVTDSSRDFFDKYMNRGPLFLVCYKGSNKPYCLISYESQHGGEFNQSGVQIRDIHNDTISKFDKELQDIIVSNYGLYYTDSLIGLKSISDKLQLYKQQFNNDIYEELKYYIYNDTDNIDIDLLKCLSDKDRINILKQLINRNNSHSKVLYRVYLDALRQGYTSIYDFKDNDFLNYCLQQNSPGTIRKSILKFVDDNFSFGSSDIEYLRKLMLIYVKNSSCIELFKNIHDYGLQQYIDIQLYEQLKKKCSDQKKQISWLKPYIEDEY